MARIRRLLPAAIAAVLLLSLIFVNGSIAQPLGEGLLQQFGVSSSQPSGGTEAAPLHNFGLPVTVMNSNQQPVPVTVQGATSQPLTATINGTVDTQDVNDPSAQPFEKGFIINADAAAPEGDAGTSFAVPAGKRLIIRYISSQVTTSPNASVRLNVDARLANGADAIQFIPLGSVDSSPSVAYHTFGLQTWIIADSGTSLIFNVLFDRDDGVSPVSGIVTISGYLVDMP